MKSNREELALKWSARIASLSDEQLRKWFDEQEPVPDDLMKEEQHNKLIEAGNAMYIYMRELSTTMRMDGLVNSASKVETLCQAWNGAKEKQELSKPPSPWISTKDSLPQTGKKVPVRIALDKPSPIDFPFMDNGRLVHLNENELIWQCDMAPFPLKGMIVTHYIDADRTPSSVN